MTEASGRRVLAAAPVAVLVAAALGACTAASPREVADDPDPTRPAGADACVAAWRPHRLHGLPLTDAATQRIAPGVVGEKLTWRDGRRQIVAWVGIDAIDVYEDLDFVPVREHGGRVWTTKAVPGLYVAESGPRVAGPCGQVFVSTTGLGAGVGRGVVQDLRVHLVPAG